MANFRKEAIWHDGIYQLKRTDPVVGGEDGASNKPLKELADRTEYLNQRIDNFNDAITAPDGFRVVGQVESIEELRTIEPTEDQQRILVKSYYEGQNKGGGVFYADFSDSGSRDDGDLTVVTSKGKRWKRVSAERNQWGSVLHCATKRRILHNLPITFPDYQAVLNQIKTTDTWMYPQAFTVDKNVIYVLYYTNASFKAVIACFDFISGRYLGYYIAGNKTAGGVCEGVVIKDDTIFVGFDSHIVAFALPASYNVRLTEKSSIDVNLKAQFSYSNGEWIVEQNLNAATGFSTRTRFAVYDNEFVLKRYHYVPLQQSGYASNNDTAFTKRQSISFKHGYTLSGLGGYYDNSKTVSPKLYQGAVLAVGDNILAQAVYEPKLLLNKLNDIGVRASRVENEGCHILDDGRCLTLSCINPSEQLNNEQGMLIIEEFSQHPNAIDFSDCAIQPQSEVPLLNSAFGWNGDHMINPLTGEKMTRLSEIVKLMSKLDIPHLTLYIRSNEGLIVTDAMIVPKYSFVDIYNGNGHTVQIVVRNTTAIIGQFVFYPPTETITVPNQNWSGGQFWTTPAGATSAYHRAYSIDHNGNKYHWLDMQHNGDLHDLLFGGSSSGNYAFNNLKFCTSKGDGGKGYNVHWYLGVNGHLMPNDSNKNIGSADVRVNELYANAPATSDVSHRVVNSSWVNSFLKSKFSQSLSKNGWQKLPSGLIIQWGVYNSDNGSDFSFPIAFNSVFFAIPGDINTSGSYVANVTLTNISNTGFSMLKTGDLGAFGVIALGV